MNKSGSRICIGSTRAGTVARVILASLLLSISSGCAWLDAQQRRVIYRPTLVATNATITAPEGAQLYFLDLPGDQGKSERISLWWWPNSEAMAPTLLYLHGTFRNLQGNQHKIDALHRAGFNVLAPDYRGWGASSAITPSEETIMADAQLAWTELTRREPRSAQRVIYGHSMGSGVAVALASRLSYPNDYGAVILESAFTSFADVAHEAGFWASAMAALTTERFASIEKIAQVQAPLLMLHGTRDNTVPLVLGERLFAAARAPKQWVAIEGAGHSDLNLVAGKTYQRALQNFRADHMAPAASTTQ